MQNMNTGISADEACRTHSLTEQDFARICNPDGSLKNEQNTTFTLKDNPSRSVTVNNNVLYGSIAILGLIVLCVVALTLKRRNKKLA